MNNPAKISKIFCIVAIAAVPVACVGPAGVPTGVTTTPINPNGTGTGIDPNGNASNPNDPNGGTATPAQPQVAVTIVKTDAPTQCVSKAPDGTVQLQTCSGDANQFWSLSGGLMTNQKTCLNAKADSPAAAVSGTALEFVDCDKTKTTQLWSYDAGGIHLAGTQQCISVPSNTDKAVAQLDNCFGGNPNEVVTLNHTDGKVDDKGKLVTTGFTIGFTSAPGKCLTLASDKLADGTLVELDDCRGAASQLWTWDALQLQVGAGLCLNLPDTSLTDGTQLQSKTCGSDVTFQWQYNDGTIQLNRGDGKTSCADLASGATVNGTRVNAFGCAGQPQQQWVLGIQ